jgi:hypothetical protein
LGDGVDDVTAAAVLNPGTAAWKTIIWEGELAAGRNQHVLDQLLAVERTPRSGSIAPITSSSRRSPPRAL